MVRFQEQVFQEKEDKSCWFLKAGPESLHGVTSTIFNWLKPSRPAQIQARGYPHLLMRERSNNLWPSLIYHIWLALLGEGTWGVAVLYIDFDSVSLSSGLQLTVTAIFCCTPPMRIFNSVWSCFHCAVNVHSPVCLPSPKMFTEITQFLWALFSYSLSLYMFILFKFLTLVELYQKKNPINLYGAFIWVPQKFIPISTW